MNEYETFESWLNGCLEDGLPADVAAVNFNLYENDEDAYDVQLIGAPAYDPEDSDWACKESFSTGENLCTLTADGWEDCQNKVMEFVQTYLNTGKFAQKLTALEAVCVGFVDGDLEAVYERDAGE